MDLLFNKLGRVAWRRYLLSAGVVVSLTASGLVLPGLLLDPGLKGYVSEASVKVSDPKAGVAGVQRMAVQIRETLLSPIALGLMVSDLKLQPADLTGTQEQGQLGVLLDLLAGGDANTGPVAGATETALKNAVSLSSPPSSDEISVDVTAATPEASQRIASYLAARVIREIGVARHDPELQAVEAARSALDSAEAALTGFQMRHGNDAVSRIQGLQQNIREDEATTLALTRRNTELTDAISNASSMKVDDVLNRALPALAEFAPLQTIRQTYTTAKLALAEVSVDHGPKHPRTIAAQSTLDAARATAMPALRRVLEALKQDQTTVAAALETRAGTRAELDSQLQAMGNAPADLARLEAGLEKARSDYIISSEAAGTFSSAPRISAALATPAEPGIANYDGFTAMAMALAGGAAGLLLSLFALSFRYRKTEADVEDAQAVEIEPVAETATDTSVVDDVEIEPAIFEDLTEVEAVVQPVTPEELEVDIAPSMAQADEPQIDTIIDEAANDVPLDERVRQVLMRNAVPAHADESREDVETPEERQAPVFRLPPLLAAALAGEAHHAQEEPDDLRALRQELARLKERLSERVEKDREGRNRA